MRGMDIGKLDLRYAGIFEELGVGGRAVTDSRDDAGDTLPGEDHVMIDEADMGLRGASEIVRKSLVSRLSEEAPRRARGGAK